MKKEKVNKLIKEIIPYIIVIILVVLIRTFLVTPARVDGKSMEPTLKNNNLVLLNKVSYKIDDIKRFDIVVLNYNGEKLIKRVIGLPGEYIEYKVYSGLLFLKQVNSIIYLLFMQVFFKLVS